MSMFEGRVQSFTSWVKRLLTCLEGLRDSSLRMVAWICITRSVRISAAIRVSMFVCWREAISGRFDVLLVDGLIYMLRTCVLVAYVECFIQVFIRGKCMRVLQ